MTVQQFIELDKPQKEEALTSAVKLAERLQPDFKYEIYQLDDFYVEVKIEMPGDTLVGLQTFETLDELEPYLNLMDSKADGTDE